MNSTRNSHHLVVGFNDTEWAAVAAGRAAQAELGALDAFESGQLRAARLMRQALLAHCAELVEFVGAVEADRRAM